MRMLPNTMILLEGIYLDRACCFRLIRSLWYSCKFLFVRAIVLRYFSHFESSVPIQLWLLASLWKAHTKWKFGRYFDSIELEDAGAIARYRLKVVIVWECLATYRLGSGMKCSTTLSWLSWFLLKTAYWCIFPDLCSSNEGGAVDLLPQGSRQLSE